MSDKFKLRNLLIDRADLVDRGANQEAHIMLYKHAGPGGHPSGSSQDVHGDRGSGGSSRGKPRGKPKVIPGPKKSGSEGNLGSSADGSGSNKHTPWKGAPLKALQRRVRSLAAKGINFENPNAELKAIAAEIRRSYPNSDLPSWVLPVSKSTPARARALRALAAAKKRNKARMAEGKNPIVAGKEVPPSSLSKDNKEARVTSRQLYAEITKGLIEADIFVEDATGDDLRDILPHNTIAKIDGLLSAKSAGIHKESIMDFDVDDLAPEVAEYIAELEDNVSALSKALEEVVEEEPLDLIEKAFAENPELAEVIKADRERLAKAESELEEARIEKANSIWVSKAQSLPAIVEQPSEFGAALRKLNDAFPDEVATIVSALELANSRVEKSLFAEYGSGGRNNVSDALAQATSIAKSIQEANPDLSLEEARARAWETNPELYEQYVQDSRSNK